MTSDAAQHMNEKEYFSKVDSSQLYHCIQMADEQSLQLLSFDSSSRTFAEKRFVQG